MKKNQNYFLIFNIACLVHQVIMPMRPKLPTMIPAPFGPSKGQSSTFAAPSSTVSSAQIQQATQQQFYPAQQRRLPFMSREEINALAYNQQPEELDELQAITTETMIPEILEEQAIAQELEQLPQVVTTQITNPPIQSKQATTTLVQSIKGPKSKNYPFATFAPRPTQLQSPQADIPQEPRQAAQLRKKSLPKTSLQSMTIARHIRPAPKKSDLLEKIVQDVQTLETIEEVALNNPLEDLALLVEKTTKPQRRSLPEKNIDTALQEDITPTTTAPTLNPATPLETPTNQQAARMRKQSATIPTMTAQPKMSATIPAPKKTTDDDILQDMHRLFDQKRTTVPSLSDVTTATRRQRSEQTLKTLPELTPQSITVALTPTQAMISPTPVQTPDRPRSLTTELPVTITPTVLTTVSPTPIIEEIIELPTASRQAQPLKNLPTTPAIKPQRKSLPEKKLDAALKELTPQPSTPSAQVMTTSDLPPVSPSSLQALSRRQALQDANFALTPPTMSSTVSAPAKIADDESLQGLNLLFAEPRKKIEQLPITSVGKPQRRSLPEKKLDTALQENITPPSATPTLTAVEQMPKTIELITPLQEQEKKSLLTQPPVLPVVEVEIPTDLLPKKSEEIAEPIEEEVTELFSVPAVSTQPALAPASPQQLSAPTATQPTTSSPTSAQPTQAAKTAQAPTTQQPKLTSDSKRKIFPRYRPTLKQPSTQKYIQQTTPRTFDQTFSPQENIESSTFQQPRTDEYYQESATPYALFNMNEIEQQQDDFFQEEPELFENLSDQDWQDELPIEQYPVQDFNVLNNQPVSTKASLQQPTTISSHTSKALPKISTTTLTTPQTPDIIRTPSKSQTIPISTAQPTTVAPTFPLTSILMSIGVIIIASLLFLI